ncbi:MAG: hypothetical protein NC205_04020, partial [Prevotella sp.]|nr:hypothetical protein [Prevotella sp.]MCM1474077.1 hypothetical protein [Muribaculaceae bacterium]
QIVNNYERYKNIAVNLEWTEFNSKYYDWFKKYPVGIFVTVCDFPENYVKNNFEQAYVQTVLTYMAYSEEFKEDFRNTPSNELLKYMTQAKDFYAIYMTYEELRMKSVTEDYLIQQIKWHTGDDDIPESDINSVIPYLTGAENIEIGGSYLSDNTFISIKDNSIMLIDCAIFC